MRRHMPSGGALIGMGTGNISSDSDMFRILWMVFQLSAGVCTHSLTHVTQHLQSEELQEICSQGFLSPYVIVKF